MGTGIFVVGSDTEVGKTFQSIQLAIALKPTQLKLGAYKPVASGIPITDSSSDARQLALACDIELDLIEKVCPQSFAAPMAPPVAAWLENRQVDEELLAAGALWWTERSELVLVEAAGGIMSPISQKKTVLDLAEQLNFPLILVVGNRLGSVSQTLTATAVIRQRNLQLLGIVLNDWPQAITDQQRLIQNSNLELVRQFLPDVAVVSNAADLLELAVELTRA
jgi:dethiobiotin synthetase